MSWIEAPKVVHDEAGKIELVLLDAHHDALGEFIAAVSGRVGSIGQNLRGVGAGMFVKNYAHAVSYTHLDVYKRQAMGLARAAKPAAANPVEPAKKLRRDVVAFMLISWALLGQSKRENVRSRCDGDVLPPIDCVSHG